MDSLQKEITAVEEALLDLMMERLRRYFGPVKNIRFYSCTFYNRRCCEMLTEEEQANQPSAA